MNISNKNDIGLQINDIQFFANEKYSGMRILWSSRIGFGQYDIYKKENGDLLADSEYMDSQEDKEFGRKLLILVADKMNIA